MNQTYIPTAFTVTRLQMSTIFLRPHNLVELEFQTSVPRGINGVFCVEGLFGSVGIDKASAGEIENRGKTTYDAKSLA